MLVSLADLITMATFLSITPSIKDAFNSTLTRGEKRGNVHLAVILKALSSLNYVWGDTVASPD